MEFNHGEIYTVKLTSGEEVIAKVTGVEGNSLTLTHPLTIAPGPQGMGLVPSIFTAENDKPVTLNTNTITMFAITAEPVRVKYIEATTGITTASKKIVLG